MKNKIEVHFAKFFYSLLHPSLLVALCILICNSVSFAQARIVLHDDVVLNIYGGTSSSNAAYVVVDNSNQNAITSTGNGRIHSEGEFNVLRWNISDATGTYVVPFGDDANDVLPLSMSISSSGSTGGSIDFSTYPTANDNTPLPNGVTSIAHQNDPTNSIQQGAKTYNRFWLTKSNHTTIPSGNLSFAYKAAGMTGDLTYGSTPMAAQFYNGTAWSLTQFGADDNNGIISGIAFSNTSFGSAWTLVQNGAPLPITLVSFNAVWDNNEQSVARVFWSTASELDNDYFQVQRSKDGFNWFNIEKVEGAGTSINTLNYEIFDNRPLNGISYYRLKQVDFDGTESYSNIVALNKDQMNPAIAVYPNPASNIFHMYFSGFETEVVHINILDNSGRVVYQLNPNILNNPGQVVDVRNFQSGVYFIHVTSETENFVEKIVIKN